MITGDKQETAINIATSCKLIKNLERLMICNAPHSTEDAVNRLNQLLGQIERPRSGRLLRKNSESFKHDIAQVILTLLSFSFLLMSLIPFLGHKSPTHRTFICLDFVSSTPSD